jgi:hypothetical protein
MNVAKSALAVGVVLVFMFALILAMSSFTADEKDYDEFAQCLTTKGLTLYGSIYCGHCSEQKKMFGDSWKHITYVECSLPNAPGQSQACTSAGIEAYPTWKYSNGSIVLGRQSFQKLSEMSGCTLP